MAWLTRILCSTSLALCAGCSVGTPMGGDIPDGGAPDLADRPHLRAPARADIAYGYDPTSARIIAFGGDDGPEVATTLHPHYHDDTWLYDLKTGDWTASLARGPSARGRAAFAMDTIHRRLLLALGRSRAADAKDTISYDLPVDTWAYDPATDAWTQLMPSGMPPGRSAPSTVYDAPHDRLVMFGGNLGSAFNIFTGLNPTNETWQLTSGSAWSKVATKGTTPPARYLAASALDDKRHRLIVAGGCCDNMGGFFSDVWALDLATDTWSELLPGGDALTDRLGASAAYDAAADQVVVFGGHDLTDLGHVNDTLGLQLGGAPTWKLLGAGDQADNTVLGCAGNKTEQPFNFTKVDAASPERRERAVLSAASDRIVLFGGEGDCAQLNDTWTFAAGTWTRRIPASQGESCLRRGEQCTCLCQ